jgi:hypothetical protein
MRSRLRCVKGCAAMAAPVHVPVVACAPHRRNRPALVAVVVAVGAARWRHNDPAALRMHEIAHVVVGELVARIGHGDVVPRPPTMNVRKSDKDSEDR